MDAMLNMIRMELYRMFHTKSLYIIWFILTAGILFTTSLSAEEWKTYTMEEKQEQYEYATGQRTDDQVNFGMNVTIPTKPGDEVSVFDLFYANIKGKFIALFMVIFAVLFSTADLTSGFVKNIGGQVKNRGSLVLAKAVVLFVYTVLTMLLFVVVQAVSNAVFFGNLTFGPWKTFLSYGALQLLLHFAFVVIAMGIAIVLHNNVISMVAVVCMCMNALTIFYGFLDKVIEKLGVEDFSVIKYTVSGNITMLGMNMAEKTVHASLIASVGFILVMLMICSVVFQKRDI